MTREEKLNQMFADMLWNNPPKEVAASQSRDQLGGFCGNNMAPGKLCEQSETMDGAS